MSGAPPTGRDQFGHAGLPLRGRPSPCRPSVRIAPGRHPRRRCARPPSSIQRHRSSSGPPRIPLEINPATSDGTPWGPEPAPGSCFSTNASAASNMTERRRTVVGARGGRTIDSTAPTLGRSPCEIRSRRIWKSAVLSGLLRVFVFLRSLLGLLRPPGVPRSRTELHKWWARSLGALSRREHETRSLQVLGNSGSRMNKRGRDPPASCGFRR